MLTYVCDHYNIILIYTIKLETTAKKKNSRDEIIYVLRAGATPSSRIKRPSLNKRFIKSAQKYNKLKSHIPTRNLKCVLEFNEYMHTR